MEGEIDGMSVEVAGGLNIWSGDTGFDMLSSIHGIKSTTKCGRANVKICTSRECSNVSSDSQLFRMFHSTSSLTKTHHAKLIKRATICDRTNTTSKAVERFRTKSIMFLQCGDHFSKRTKPIRRRFSFPIKSKSNVWSDIPTNGKCHSIGGRINFQSMVVRSWTGQPRRHNYRCCRPILIGLMTMIQVKRAGMGCHFERTRTETRQNSTIYFDWGV